MNTNHLKKFAQEARRKLIQQVSAKLEYVLTTDSVELRERGAQLKRLRGELSKSSKEQIIEKVSYTWFNRLMALRFMDANDYQPLGIRIITPKDGFTIPELLDEAKRGNIPEELKVNRGQIYDILDGKIASNNPQNEAFKVLLIATCNHLNTTFPFLFERIHDYTELLIPDDLTSDFSIVKDIKNGMLSDDCKNVEIIGWLYQFYISEENERLIKEKKSYKKNELAPASQLFTPKWIVQYMVDNTLGQLLTELFPNTRITKNLEFYIQPSYLAQLQPRESKKIEEIRFFDPCVGSAHILSYAFDVFYLIYKEQGYSEIEIPELILSNNLFGTDIDERATQLSSFALMMKGRKYFRRFLQRKVKPNIGCFYDYDFDSKFKNASSIGSLIKVEPFENDNIVAEEGSVFEERQKELKQLYSFLGQRYDIVVTNPPYIASTRMEGTLKQYVENKYPETKSDLFATFIIKCLELCNDDGFTGYMSPFVWMFISSYEKLRKAIINNHLINNLVQLEYSGFDGATVPVCTFTIRKRYIPNAHGSYIKLSNFKGAKTQAPKTLEAIRDHNCGWFYTANQNDFNAITGNAIGYFASKNAIKSFSVFKSLQENFEIKSGIRTGIDEYFLRYWSEVNYSDIGFQYNSIEDVNYSTHTYFPMNKEDGYRRWTGRYKVVVKYTKNGKNFSDVSGLDYRLRDSSLYFKEGISWGDVTSSKSSYRYQKSGLIFSTRAPVIFSKDKYLVALLNSKIVNLFQEILNPTLSFGIVDLKKIPIPDKNRIPERLDITIDQCLSISQNEWDSKELSWDFKHNAILLNSGQDIEEAVDLFKQYWKIQFFQLHKNEEELNRTFIEIYGLQDELSHQVPLEDISILQDELDKKDTVLLNNQLIRDSKTLMVQNYNEIELPLIQGEIVAQFISYSVGCIFGRYSLDKEGLIISNQGEGLHDYMEKISKSQNECSFLPDADNIIPILDNEWFEDDIAGRFNEFVKVTFGDKHFNRNIAYIEEQIGKDVRRYFINNFYSDHIKRYKKRPIYWMFSSPNGSFNALIYMHRYTPDTVSNLLNKYLKEFVEKLSAQKEYLNDIQISGSSSEKTKAIKEIEKIDKMQLDLNNYERNILYPLAIQRIEIDIDDGVLVNYNKFGKAVKQVQGLNDPKTKAKVKKFDWIDTSQIR